MSEVFRPVIKLKRRRARFNYDKEQEEPWTKKSFKVLKLFLPFLILVVYVLCAAAVFYVYEKDCGNNFACPLNQIHVSEELVLLNETKKINVSDAEKASVIKSVVIDEAKKTTLSYWQAVDFIVISISTIGYGDIVPCTTEGEVIVIVISILGLPIMIIALNKIGKFLGLILHKVWRVAYMALFKPPYSDERERQLQSDYVPLSLCLVVTSIYVVLCALYFDLDLNDKYTDRQFTFFTAFYFTMITFTTVGYGDFAPIDYDKIGLNLLLIFLGLALVALSIRIMRNEMEELVVDVVALIERKFVAAITDGSSPMPPDEKQAVDEMLNESRKSASLGVRVISPFVSADNEKQLQRLYSAKSRFISAEVQAVPLSEGIQTQFPEKPVRTFVDGSCQTNEAVELKENCRNGPLGREGDEVNKNTETDDVIPEGRQQVDDDEKDSLNKVRQFVPKRRPLFL